jgi:uncharacterized protein (TIGR00369 family)
LSVNSERFATAPISQLVGFDVQPGEAGEATVLIEACSRHHNPMGRVHGGLLAALADAAMGIAFGRTLLDSEDFSTIEMKINFIRPIREGMLTANAKIVQRGLRVGFVECEIVNTAGKLVATATCTCMIVSS